jgi:hypothetical protein
MPKKVRPYGSAVDAESAGRRGRLAPGEELMSELASTLTVREIATEAAEAIRALNDLTREGGDLSGVGEVRDVIASLELMSHGLPRLCEQLARFLVTQREDGQLRHAATRGQHGPVADPDFTLVEVTEALTAAGQAADMLTAALDQARSATEELGAAR